MKLFLLENFFTKCLRFLKHGVQNIMYTTREKIFFTLSFFSLISCNDGYGMKLF